MLRLNSLRSRLILVYTLIIVLGFGLLALLAGQQISAAAEEDFGQQAESEVILIASALSDTVENFAERELSSNQMQQILAGFADQTDTTLTLLDNRGNTVLATDADLAAGSFADAPEVQAAQNRSSLHEIRSDPDNEQSVFAAAPVRYEGQTLAIVHMIKSTSEARVNVEQRWLSLGGIVLLITLITMILTAIISTWLTRPLLALQYSAQRLSDGDFAHRLQTQRQDEIGDVTRAFNHMAAEVESMLEEQRNFSSNVSHELRTPLTTIQLRAEALLRPSLADDRRQQYTTEIHGEVLRLASLVQDLILLSRFESGRAELGHDYIDMVRFARRMVDDFQAQAAAAGITLDLEAPAELPTIEANFNHLEVAFRNILDNSLKYSTAGDRVTWKLSQVGEYVVAEIKDTGRGIAPDDLSQVLKRFYRVEKGHQQRTQGIGLGLPLVQSIASLYGATLNVASAGLGSGTEVTVTWPSVAS